MNSVVLVVLGLLAVAQGGYLHSPAVTYGAHPLVGGYHVAPSAYGIGYHPTAAIHPFGYTHPAHGLVRVARSAQPDPQIVVGGPGVIRTHHHPYGGVYGGVPAYSYPRSYGYAPYRTVPIYG